MPQPQPAPQLQGEQVPLALQVQGFISDSLSFFGRRPPWAPFTLADGGGPRVLHPACEILGGCYTSTHNEATERAMRDILAVSKALSDENRLRALLAVKDGELCLCQIIPVLGLSPATVSKHMDVLEKAGLVTRRREGKWRYYKLADETDNTVAAAALDWVKASIRGDARLAADSKKIRQVKRQDLVELAACYRS